MGEYLKGFEVGLAAGRSAAEVTEWKLIETAPKDGTEVWLGKAAEDPRGRRVTVGYWHGKQGWQGPDDTGLGWQPSHWQPYHIPEPPPHIRVPEQREKVHATARNF